MLEFILDKRIIYVLMGVFAAVGVLSKLISSAALRKLNRAAKDMGKSTHSLMHLVRARFEHTCMVSDKVENVHVFVDKYLYEYKVCGVKLYSLRRMEKTAVFACLALGVLGAGLQYVTYGMQEQVIRVGATGSIMAVLLYLFQMTSDEAFYMGMIRNYMVDYLENVCLPRYERSNRKETKREEEEFEVSEKMPMEDKEDAPVHPNPGKVVPSPQTPPEITPPVMPEPYKVPDVQTPVRGASQEQTPVTKMPKQDRDALIRQILEEFMA